MNNPRRGLPNVKQLATVIGATGPPLTITYSCMVWQLSKHFVGDEELMQNHFLYCCLLRLCLALRQTGKYPPDYAWFSRPSQDTLKFKSIFLSYLAWHTVGLHAMNCDAADQSISSAKAPCWIVSGFNSYHTLRHFLWTIPITSNKQNVLMAHLYFNYSA